MLNKSEDQLVLLAIEADMEVEQYLHDVVNKKKAIVPDVLSRLSQHALDDLLLQAVHGYSYAAAKTLIPYGSSNALEQAWNSYGAKTVRSELLKYRKINGSKAMGLLVLIIATVPLWIPFFVIYVLVVCGTSALNKLINYCIREHASNFKTGEKAKILKPKAFN